MRAAILLFILVALTLVLLFLLSRPPIGVTIPSPQINTSASPIVGAPTDMSPTGYSLLVSMVKSLGYNVTFAAGSTENLFLAGNLTPGGVELVVSKTAESLGPGGEMVILVAPEDYRKLPAIEDSIEKALTYNGFRKTSPYNYALTAFNLRTVVPTINIMGSAWVTNAALNDVARQMGQVVVWTYPEGESVGVLIQYTRSDGAKANVLYLASGLTLRNDVIQAGIRRGVTPQQYIGDLLLIAGTRPGETVAFPIDAYRLPPLDPVRGGITLRLNIREIVAEFLSGLGEWLRGVASMLVADEFRILMTSLGLLLVGMMLGRGIIGAPYKGKELAPLRPPEPVRATGYSKEFLLVTAVGGNIRKMNKYAAKQLIRSLYSLADIAVQRLYNVSLEQAVRQGMLSPKGKGLTGDPGLDALLYRLYVIYTRKVAARKLFPLVWDIRREAQKLYEGVLPLLERAQIRLSGERGVEYVGL